MTSKTIFNKKKLNKTTRVTIFIIMVLVVIFLPTGVVGEQSQNNINLGDQLPHLPVGGQALFESYYRGVKQNYMPDMTNINDFNFKYWNSTNDIKNGLSLLKTVSALNPNYPNLYDEFVNSNSTAKSLLLKNNNYSFFGLVAFLYCFHNR